MERAGMKIDFHFHAVLSKKVGFDPVLFQQTIQHARQVGLDGLAMTNHLNTPDFEGVYAYLDGHYPYSGATYDVEGVKLFPGIEVHVREGPHFVVIGEREEILVYHRRFRSNLTPETYCTARDVIERQEGLALLTIFAHPFRPKREITRIDPTLYPYFDALELNARDLFFLGREIVTRTEQVARQHRWSIVAGTDAHHYHQLGSVHNEFDLESGSVAGFRTAIANGEYTIHIHDLLDQRVAAARKAKEAIKQAKLGMPAGV
jgi:PHP family Zn ribbon phosphoesterase